ncbi:hypothetical protein SLEP1_g39518 [Rubroshorea leprosula]|uniref:Uncharacterized protein n=1 Tax=Rubroshorea leprosula TaxID=152421 RepID=A0AAV5L0V7_9ROSI|nr:hypothetical protein SLEP1_g39518 [Rubroshorea leprosula]
MKYLINRISSISFSLFPPFLSLLSCLCLPSPPLCCFCSEAFELPRSTIATITSVLSPRIFTIPLLSISSSSQPPPSSPVIIKAEGFGSYQKWGEDEADLAGNHGSEAFTESPTHRRQVEEDVRGVRRAACGVRRSSFMMKKENRNRSAIGNPLFFFLV